MLKFTTVEGDFRLSADGVAHRYLIWKDGKTWRLVIWTLKDLQGIKVSDERIESDTADLKRLVVATANAFEDLGEDYASHEHGYLRRFVKASNTAYDAEIARLEAR